MRKRVSKYIYAFALLATLFGGIRMPHESSCENLATHNYGFSASVQECCDGPDGVMLQ